MSEELRAQWAFTRAFEKWSQYAHEQGFEFTYGDAFAKTGHSPNSYHYRRRAIDINLFKDGVYLDHGCPEWEMLGAYWVSLGGTWGGNFQSGSRGDYNHLSWGEGR